jgi:hypothetical protein
LVRTNNLNTGAINSNYIYLQFTTKLVAISVSTFTVSITKTYSGTEIVGNDSNYIYNYNGVRIRNDLSNLEGGIVLTDMKYKRIEEYTDFYLCSISNAYPLHATNPNTLFIPPLAVGATTSGAVSTTGDSTSGVTFTSSSILFLFY